MNNEFSLWVTQVQARVERALAERLPSADSAPYRLHAAMRYATLGGGKRVRALLCFAAGEVFAAPVEAIDAAASAVEMMHAYSLVHDDLPCMDDDDLRRGKPSCHKQFDEATALLAGDALQAQAFISLAQATLTAEKIAAMLALLAEAAGAGGMCGGQAMDLAAVGGAQTLSLAELEYMHICKTGALIRAAVLLGAYCGNASAVDLAVLKRYANRLGLLFQVVDDILDDAVPTATLGKTAGKDRAGNKPTYVTLLGRSAAQAQAKDLHTEAIAAINELNAPQNRLQNLRHIADYILQRDH